jgi:hypothetical protein
LTRNTISQCGVAAIEVYNESTAYIEANRFVKPGKYALMAFTGGRITATENSISGVDTSLISLTAFGGGTFRDNNEIADCPAALSGLTSAPYLLKNNGVFLDVTNDEALAVDGVTFVPTGVDPNAGKCLVCGAADRKFHCAPCGHKVFCQTCATRQGPLQCPLCRFPVESVTEGFRVSEDGICHMCLTERADGIVLPCGHIEFCVGCLVKWFAQKATCPSCNSDKVSFKRVLPDY